MKFLYAMEESHGLLLITNGRSYGVECKRADAPRATPSMRIALHDLNLEHLAVVYPGLRRYAIADRMTALPLEQMTGASLLGKR